MASVELADVRASEFLHRAKRNRGPKPGSCPKPGSESAFTVDDVRRGVLGWLTCPLNRRVVGGTLYVYLIVRVAEIPKISIHTDAPSGHGRHANVGEAGVGAIGPTVANAVFAATSVRLVAMSFGKRNSCA